MDALAVALAAGMMLQKVGFRHTFRLAWHFGLFQSMMPILGWSMGQMVEGLVKEWDHWIAFVFLLVIGFKMVLDSRHEEEKALRDPTKGMRMVMLSIATSIDAFAVGMSLSLLGISIWYPAAIIGIVCCIITAMGIHMGAWLGVKSRLGNYAECVGGLILLAIGLGILHEHHVF